MRRIVALVLALAFTAGCNPLSCCAPADLPADAPVVVTSTDDAFPSQPVQVTVDEHGVPHVVAGSEVDAAYGMGFMQGRDRTFQLFFLKKATAGRLTEVLGAGLLPTDQYLRVLSYRADEWLERLDERDRALADAFAAGVNDGVAHAGGGSVEQTILGARWEPWTAQDVLHVARFMLLDQSAGMNEERARARILDRIDPADPRLGELIVSVPSNGVPIVSAEEDSAAPTAVAATAPPAARLSKRVAKLPRHAVASPRDPARRALAAAPPFLRGMIAGLLDEEEPGGSNSWAVRGELTSDGASMLANDPHLRHDTPSLWYMAHLRAPDLDVVGAAVAGLPFIGIGRGPRVAWGFTNGYTDNMDLVEIHVVEGEEDMYWLDGVPTPFGRIVQRYETGGGEAHEETWRTTVFGPVMPPGWANELDDGHVWAVQWVGWTFLPAMNDTVSALFDMSRATAPDEAGVALQRVVAPVFSSAMLFDDGTIAMRQTGWVPRRTADVPAQLPRDGRTRAALWQEALTSAERPQLLNPARGFINATNQRVVDDDGPHAESIGGEGAEPWRALRVDERIRAMIEDGKPSPEELFAIQQDVVHVGARAAASTLGDACPKKIDGHDDGRAQAFCDALRGFDGAFTIDAAGALPWVQMHAALVVETYAAHVGDDVAASIATQSFVRMAVYQAIEKAAAGERPLLFDDPATDDYDGLAAFVARAAKPALDEVVRIGGPDPVGWRWGGVHRRKLAGRLAAAPFIGGLFEGPPLEQAGFANTPRAESGVPWVTNGAGLRLFATAKDGRLDAKMVIDTGQSGHTASKHWADQVAPWNEGEPLDLHVDDFEQHAEGRLELRPK